MDDVFFHEFPSSELLSMDGTLLCSRSQKTYFKAGSNGGHRHLVPNLQPPKKQNS